MPYSHPQPLDRNQAHQQIRHLLPGAVCFSMTAGYVNTVALGFFHTPVSHMTGAVSHLGIDFAEAKLRDAGASLSIVLGFLFGAMLAGLIVGAWKLIPGRRYGVAMMVEGLLIALGAALITAKHRMGLPVVAMACGLQNATTSSYCGLIIRTTHVTGLVTDIGVMLGHWVRHRQIDLWKLRFLSWVVISFTVGGCLGAALDLRFGPSCLAAAAVVVTTAGAVFFYITHQGLVDLMQDVAPHTPHTGTFPRT